MLESLLKKFVYSIGRAFDKYKDGLTESRKTRTLPQKKVEIQQQKINKNCLTITKIQCFHLPMKNEIVFF